MTWIFACPRKRIKKVCQILFRNLRCQRFSWHWLNTWHVEVFPIHITFKTFTLIICKQIKLQQTLSSNEPQRDELQRDEPEPQRTAILYTINCTYTYWHSYLIHSHHSSLKHASSVLFLRFQMPWASWLLLPVLIRLRWRTTWKRYKLGQSKQLPPATSIKANRSRSRLI